MRRFLTILFACVLAATTARAQLVPTPVVNVAGYTYSAASPDYTGYSSPTDFFAIQGSATKVIEIVNVRLSGYATANNNIDIGLIKRSTANTGGTATPLTLVPLDSNNPAPTATIVTYGSAPTLGNSVGQLCACQIEVPAKAGVGGYILEWQFNRNGGSPVVLHGTNEMLALNAYGVTFPSGTNLNITIQWTEH